MQDIDVKWPLKPDVLEIEADFTTWHNATNDVESTSNQEQEPRTIIIDLANMIKSLNMP